MDIGWATGAASSLVSWGMAGTVLWATPLLRVLDRSGDAATKKIACDLEFPRARDTPLHGEPGSQTGVDKSLTVVSVGRNRQGRTCRLRMG